MDGFPHRSKVEKIILFDFGGTLASLAPAKEEIFTASAESIGLSLSTEAVKRAYFIVDFNNKYSSVRIKNEMDRRSFYHNYNKRLCAALGISGYFDKLEPVLQHNFSTMKKWEMHKNVLFVLEQLYKRKIPLCVAANWDRDLVLLVEKLGISRYFSSVIASQESGIEKPNPAFLKKALDKLPFQADKEYVFYIGNEYETDVLCARDAGIVPVLVDVDNNYPYADCLKFGSIIEVYNALC